MDLVNLMYKYFNRFINGKDLIKKLKGLDRNAYNEDDKKNLDDLIHNIDNILESIPNKVDEIEKKRIKDLDEILKVLKGINNNESEEKETLILKERYNKLLKEKEEVKDGGQLYENISKTLFENKIIIKYLNNMSKEELFEFITQYISMPMPFDITEENFNNLIQVGIETDNREGLWRLAFNYDDKFNLNEIADYFILKRDSYYLGELLCISSELLDLNDLKEKIIQTNDKEFILKILNFRPLQGVIDENFIYELRKFLENKKSVR